MTRYCAEIRSRNVLRRVLGKQIVEWTDAEFTRLRSQYRDVVIDIGTGNGKHAHLLGGRRPDWLVIGLDAAKDNMRKAAAKAAASPVKGGLSNVFYVWAAVEQ